MELNFSKNSILKTLLNTIKLIILSFAIFKIYQESTKLYSTGYWFDELFSLDTVYHAWDTNYLMDLLKDGIPFGYYLFLKISTALTTQKAQVARLVSILFFYLGLGYFLKKDKFSLRSIVTILLISFCPNLIYFSTEIRPYSMRILFVLISTFIFYRDVFNQKTEQIRLSGWSLINFLAIATHYTSALIPITHLLLFLLYRREQFVRVFKSRDIYLSLLFSNLALLQIFFFESSRFTFSNILEEYPYYLDALIKYYRPGLNLFLLTFLYYLFLLTFLLLFISTYKNIRNKESPDSFQFLISTCYLTFILSLIILPWFDTLYPRYQMLLFLGFLLFLSRAFVESIWGKVVFASIVIIALQTNMPKDEELKNLQIRHFFTKVIGHIQKQQTPLCLSTNDDWTEKRYIPTLAKIYKLDLIPLKIGHESECPYKKVLYLFNQHQSMDGHLLFHHYYDWTFWEKHKTATN